MKALLEAMRPYQWVKNLLVLAPLVFARDLTDEHKVGRALLALAAFCAMASAIYLLNDLLDLEKDRAHPRKRERPLPSGRLAPATARVAVVVLALAGLALAYPARALWVLGAYLLLNTLSSWRLKQVVIVDAMCVAVGFQLRIHAGGLAIEEQVSSWLILCTFFVSLLLAFCKRRHELVLLGEGGGDHRRALEEYSETFLDQMIAPLGALTVMTYALYTVSAETVQKFGTRDLVYTVPFVTYGIFRYLYLVHRRAEGGDPTRLLLRDRITVLNVVLWFATSCAILYRGQLGW
ncbi:MAG: decaprenyl-phosphate phosphoribosyltransferase [Planctomycetota bacterium]